MFRVRKVILALIVASLLFAVTPPALTEAASVQTSATRYINYTFKSGKVGTYYSDFITYGGGYTPYKVNYSGTLPPGLKLTYQRYGSRAYLQGTPTRAGTYKFRVNVYDSTGYGRYKIFTVSITSSTSKPYMLTTFKSGRVGTYYSDYIIYGGGTKPYTVSYTGRLPYGMKLTYQKNGSRAYLSGRPTRAGSYSFRVTLKDASGTRVSKTYRVYIYSRYSSYATSTSKANATANIAVPGSNKIPVRRRTDTENITSGYTYKISLKVSDDNIIKSGTDKDEDLITVKAGEPLTFTIGKCFRSDGKEVEISNPKVYVDFRYDENITISDEGKFTLPAELVDGDFVVSVKAESENSEAESDELYFEAADE